MKRLTTLGLGLGFLIASSAFAQTNPELATRFDGYAPSVLASATQADATFAKLETDFRRFNVFTLQAGTQCTARAETWTFGMDRTQQIKAEKVFVFYTQAFKEYYRQTKGESFKWWFHVAPYVLVKAESGDLEERVLDREFADHSLTMKDWTDLFIESKQKCIENVPFARFEGDVTGSGASYDKTAHCYLVRAPMYDMYPADIDARERGQRPQMEWDLNQVRFASKALAAGARKAFRDRTGL